MQEHQPVDNWMNLAMLELAWPRREGSAESAVFRSKPRGADQHGGEVYVKEGALGTHSGSRGKCLTPEVSLPCVYLLIDNLEDPLAFLEKAPEYEKVCSGMGVWECPLLPRHPVLFSPLLTDTESPGTESTGDLCDQTQAASPEGNVISVLHSHVFFLKNKQLLFNLWKNLNKQKEQTVISKHLCPPPGASRCE